MIRFTAASILLVTTLHGQQTTPPSSPQGQVLFHRSDEQNQAQQAAAKKPSRTPETVVTSITDAERSAIILTGWDLDLHLFPETARLEARARITVHNISGKPLNRLPLQLSSALDWSSVAADHPLAFTQHTVATDADHTGDVSEALVALPTPLPPGASLTLTAFYSGTLERSAARLTRIGAPPEAALRADWDGISGEMVALRGFGNVIWYPVASPPLFLGDGAKLFQAVGRSRFQQQQASFRLRATVEYKGEPPADLYVNGQRQPFTHHTEEPDVPVADSHGVAVAEIPAGALGFRTPSLFITWSAPRPSENKLLSVVTTRPEVMSTYNAAADNLSPLLTDWLGPAPLSPLTLIDHPGQPFEDDALLAIPLTAVNAQELSASLVHSMAHAWFRSSLPWLDEGVPQFMAVIQSESTDGRDKALAGLRGLITPLTMVEPAPTDAENREAPKETAPFQDSQYKAQAKTSIPFDTRNLPGPPESYSSSSSSTSTSSNEDNAPAQPLGATLPPPPGQPGQSLIAAHDEVYYRAKAAAVLFMLRSMTGDAAFRQALQHYRDYARKAEGHEDTKEFQRTLEATSHKDLGWVFDDWVYNDRGLADLSITSVTPRSLPARNGKDVSWLVAVELKNSGAVGVEVPVTVRSGTLTSTERVRIGPQSSVSTRVVFEGTPEQVVLNDGTVPETTAPLHTWLLHPNGAAGDTGPR
jgi:hypothetical protein